MNPLVRDGWQSWNDPFEGTVYTFYNDILGLTTIGVGNLCNSVAEACALDMVRVSDGIPATREEIAREWHRVHDDPSFARLGWAAAARGATVRLTKEGVASLVAAKRDQMWTHLVRRFTDVETWPWQCQMALLSMSWAAGPAFAAPKFDAACRAHDWTTAATECHLDDHANPGLRPRNAANKALFLEAVKPEEYAGSETGLSVCDVMPGR